MTVTVAIKDEVHQQTQIEFPAESGKEPVDEKSPVGKLLTFSEEPATVTVRIGYTKNLGDFESLKVTVGVTMPVANDPHSISVSADWAKVFCENKIAEIVEMNENE